MTTAFDKKVNAFCARQNIGFEWIALKWDGKKARLTIMDRIQYAHLLQAARKLRGVKVTEWIDCGGGVFEGRLYLQDADDADRCSALQDAESRRNNAWWTEYHNSLASGSTRRSAVERAEKLYPMSATKN